MALSNAGTTLITQYIIGESVNPYNATYAYLEVGNGTAAFDKAHTTLQGASKSRKGMESTYPSRSGTQLTFRGLWPTGDGNFAWEEWGTFNDATTGTMLQRKVEALGTKTSAQSWQLTVTVTVSNP